MAKNKNVDHEDSQEPAVLSQLSRTRLQTIDSAHAVTAPISVDEAWVFQEADALGQEQIALYQASAEELSRNLEADAAGSALAASISEQLVMGRVNEALAARENAMRTRAALEPWARRSPGATCWHLAFIGLLYGGDVAGITSAAVLMGDIPVLAFLLAMAVAASAVLAGKVGKDVKEEKLAAMRAMGQEEIPPDLTPWANLFVGNQGHRQVLLARGVAVGIVLMIAVGIFGLRSSIDGYLVGATFAAFSVAIALGSFINSYVYADEVADLIERADDAAQRLSRRIEEQLVDSTIIKVEEARARAASIRAEQTHLGEAASAHVQAVRWQIATRNPQVFGHAPAHPALGRKPREDAQGGDK